MKDYEINQLMKEKMKDMEVVPDDNRKSSSDGLDSAHRSTLELPQLKKKYEEKAQNISVDSEENNSSDDVIVKSVRPIDRNQDNGGGDNERTVIFKKGKVLGFQG